MFLMFVSLCFGVASNSEELLPRSYHAILRSPEYRFGFAHSCCPGGSLLSLPLQKRWRLRKRLWKPSLWDPKPHWFVLRKLDEQGEDKRGGGETGGGEVFKYLYFGNLVFQKPNIDQCTLSHRIIPARRSLTAESSKSLPSRVYFERPKQDKNNFHLFLGHHSSNQCFMGFLNEMLFMHVSAY